MISPEPRAQVLSLDKSQLIYLPHQRQSSHADAFDLLGDFVGSLGRLRQPGRSRS